MTVTPLMCYFITNQGYKADNPRVFSPLLPFITVGFKQNFVFLTWKYIYNLSLYQISHP